jgi:hypothetical protein
VPAESPTATPTAIVLPTDVPSPEPTDDPGPGLPTATPSAAVGSPTPELTPTAAPTNRPPVILDATCNPQTIKVYDQTRCEVVAEDPDGDELSYEWTVDAGVIQASDQPVAYYQAQIRIGGIAKVDIPIHVTVRDPHGGEVSDDVIVIVTPRVSKVIQGAPAWVGEYALDPGYSSTATLESSNAP